MPLKFCPRCGTRLKLKLVRISQTSTYQLACDNCGYQEQPEKKTTKIEKREAVSIKVLDDSLTKLKTMPTTKIECPKCGYEEAQWWIVQTRGGDEPSTQFYRCLRCTHTWRLYS
jgi:DNA-directed RNA polymerase subunit M